jgi:hypothetical protein
MANFAALFFPLKVLLQHRKRAKLHKKLSDCDDIWRRSRDDDEREEEEGWAERFFVGFDREVRRCVFHAHSSEIEFDGFEILVRGEWRNEKVGEEILSRERVEKEV